MQGQTIGLLREVQVRELVPVSKVTLWRMVREAKFPAPLRIGRMTMWRRAEVLAWIDAQAGSQQP